MKKRTLLITFLLLNVFALRAAYVDKLPYTITQPNGDTIHCFVSGDEFFNWIHDDEGFTIIQAADGYFYYAEKDGEIIVPSIYLVNTVDPETIGLRRWVKISEEEYLLRRETMFSFEKDTNQPTTKAPHSGNMNNIVVYIRFSDDVEFTTTRQVYDDKLNPSTGVSLKSYFKEVSYNNLTINSTHYPACALNTNLSYQDTHARAYFQPYNATTNPTGYNGDTERRIREHQLLVDAITWINANSPVSASINIDADNDNNVDNVGFIIKGTSGAWASLLWAHRWSLYSQTVYINGKRVYDYTFIPEDYYSVTTICHEMFHALGSPDLYHYTSNGIAPVGSWDLMESGSGHMTAYMKWKYSGNTWITTIPQITTNGTYTLNPLTSSTNNCYQIASPNSTDEYFVVEYRNKSGTFETNIPGSGLIVYRIDTRVTGNASGPPDEVYIYRPGGSTTVNGTPNSAHFSSSVGRTAINDATNPSSFLQNGNQGGLNISNVTAAGATISFTVAFPVPCTPPTSQATVFTSSSISFTSLTAGWTRGSGTGGVIILARAGSVVDAGPMNGSIYTANAVFGSGTQIGTGNYVVYNGSGTSVNITGLTEGTTYYFSVFEYNAADNCYKTPALTGSAATIGYCPAGSPDVTYEYISNVTLGSINQTSVRGNNGYQNYTSQTATMQIGVNTSATISVTIPYSTDQILIWIDWNKDNDFSDVGENVYTSSGSSFTSPHTTTSFAAPSGASLGTTRMRIRLHDSAAGPNATSCGTSSYGEVEDYTINVISSCIQPSAPVIGTITQPTCSLATGSVILNGLPASGTWTLTRTPGNITTTGTGTSKTINGLASGTYTYTVTDATPCTSIASANIVINTQPVTPATPTAGNNGPVCTGKTLSLTASTIAGATYTWTGPNSFTSTLQNPTVSASATPAMAGTYSVTAITNGCTGQAGSTTVVINTLPTITASASPATICAGASSSLTAGSSITPATYTWMPSGLSGTPVSVIPATTTIYTITGNVTATGCTSSSTVMVTVNPNPVITPTATPATICNGSSSSLSANSTVGGTTYVWNPGGLAGTTVNVTPGSTTTYTVTGTASGCSGSSTVTVIVNPIPNLTPTATPATLCVGASSSLSVSSSLGGTVYQWMPGGLNGTPVSVTPVSTTTYTITGTANGCSGTSTVTVTVNPKPVITPTASPAAICIGATSSLSATSSVGSTTYIWNPGSLSGTPVSVTPVSTTIYSVIGTAAGCTGSTSVAVTVNSLPILTPVATPNPICRGSNSTLSVTPETNTTYLWMPGSLSGSSRIVNPVTTTTYSVTGTNSSTNCTASTTVILTVNQKPVFTASSSPSTICPNTNSTLSANCTSNCTGINYNWTPGNYSGTSINVHPIVTTTYSVTGTNSNGCSQSTTVILTVNPNPVITPTASPSVINSGSSSSLSATSTVSGTTYVWDPGTLVSTPVTVSPVSTTTYTVIGTASGCTGSASFSVTVNPTTKTLQIKVFVEGLYIGNGMMRESSDFNPVNETISPKWNAGIADTVTVVLYNDSYGVVMAKYPGLYLNTDGTLTITGISSSLSNLYYITIFNRNCVPVTSATPRSFAGSVISYDFTTPADQAYGAGSQKDLGGGIYGLYTGELDKDPYYYIDGDDNTILEPAVILGPLGYLDTDLDGSGYVDGDDNVIMEANVIFSPLFWNPLISKKYLIINLNK